MESSTKFSLDPKGVRDTVSSQEGKPISFLSKKETEEAKNALTHESDKARLDRENKRSDFYLLIEMWIVRVVLALLAVSFILSFFEEINTGELSISLDIKHVSTTRDMLLGGLVGAVIGWLFQKNK